MLSRVPAGFEPVEKSTVSEPTVLITVASTSAVAATLRTVWGSSVCLADLAEAASALSASPKRPMPPRVAAMPPTSWRRVAADLSALSESIA
jgi:hypothetical protein